MDETMLFQMFASRLSQLRNNRNISARDMSLSLGLNPGYINNIERGIALPSMENFFLICEYFDIEPRDFFDFESKQPEELQTIVEQLKKLNSRQLKNIAEIIEDLTNK